MGSTWAAELRWLDARRYLSEMFYDGDGVEKDLVQAVYWAAETGIRPFWRALEDAAKAWNDMAFAYLGCDFTRLTMEIGRGLYWYQYEGEHWKEQDATAREFGIKCLDYYCETIELQQEAILSFLLFWNT